MKPPLKLNGIDQEHLQELYDSTGVARDELPYTEAYDLIVSGFQDRTFKNADAEQLFGALLKYTRSSGAPATEQPASTLTEDQLRQVKAVLSRHLVGGKILPYSDEFNIAKAEFNKISGMEFTELEFWRAVLRSQGSKRRPPPRKKAVAVAKEEEEDE